MMHWTGIIALIDNIATKKLQSVQQALKNEINIHGSYDPKIPPHITLMEAPELRFQQFSATLNDKLKEFLSFPLEFSNFANFPSTKIFFLSPKFDIRLYQLRKICLESAKATDVHFNREPSPIWTPHLTLFTEIPIEDIGKAINISQTILDLQIDQAFIGQIEKLALFSYPPYKTEEVFWLKNEIGISF